MNLPNVARGVYFGDLCLTDYPFLAEYGMSYAAGDLVTSVLSSFLQDGDLEVSQRRGNMSLTIPVLIEGADLLELAQAEAALALEAQKATNTLRIVPGDGYGPPTVFDTFQADLAFQFDDEFEQNATRRFVLTVSALPFGRSERMVTSDAVQVASVPDTTVINDASSATGWSSSTGTVSVVSGSIQTSGSGVVDLSLTQSFSAAGTRYIFIDYDSIGPVTAPVLNISSASGNVSKLTAARVDILPSRLRRAYWQLPSSVADAITKLTAVIRFLGAGGTFSIDQVARSSALPGVGTTRQQSRVIPVPGSARTQGGVQIASPTTALGDVLVYTSADRGLVPPLTPMRVSAAGTVDAARVSGTYTSLSAAAVFDIPLDALTPGLYGLVALASAPASDARTLSWSAVTRIGGISVGRTLSGLAVTSNSSYKFVQLGNINLPTNGARTGTSAVQRIAVSDGASGSAARLDELYVCNLTTGRLTIVSCGAGTPAPGGPSSRLWLDIASIGTRTPTVMRGSLADGTDAFYANDSIQVMGLHEFVPTTASIFTVTTAALDSTVTLTHFPRWLGHAA